MKRFMGYMVEVKVSGRFENNWIQIGLQKNENNAEVAATQTWYCGQRVVESQITEYYSVNGKIVTEPHQKRWSSEPVGV